MTQVIDPPVGNVALTQEQELAEWVKCAASPAYFIDTYCKIFDAEAADFIPFKLWPAQRRALFTVHSNKLTVALKSRQIGFTWLGLGYNLWGMLFRPIWVGMLFSRRDDEAIMILDRLKDMYNELPAWMQKWEHTDDNAHQFGLDNGSITYAFPTSGGDGYTANFVLIDEADLQPDLNRLMRSVRPTIEAGGKLFMISRVNKATPKSYFQTIYRNAKDGRNDWKALFIPWNAHPGRTIAWYTKLKADSLANTGSLDDVYEQYPTTDVEALMPRERDKRIPGAWLLRVYEAWQPLMDVPRAPAIAELRVFLPPQKGASYVIGADTAEGNPNSDESAACILNAKTGEQVAMLAGRFEPSVFASQVATLSRWYNGAPALVERNNHGHAVLLWLRDNARDVRRLLGEDKKEGWLTSSKGKAILFDKTAEAIKNEEVIVHDEETYLQLADISGSTLSAPEGEHDDRAIAAAIAIVGAISASPSVVIGRWE